MPTRKASADVVYLDEYTFVVSLNKFMGAGQYYAPNENIIVYGNSIVTNCNNGGFGPSSIVAYGETNSFSFWGGGQQGTLNGPSVGGNYEVRFHLQTPLNNYDHYISYQVIAPLPAPTLYVFANGKSSETIPYDGSVVITWYSTNTTSCSCTYYDDNLNLKSCGTGTVGNQGGMSLTLKQTKTFSVTCDNN